jgi:hypothetical protein
MAIEYTVDREGGVRATGQCGKIMSTSKVQTFKDELISQQYIKQSYGY